MKKILFYFSFLLAACYSVNAQTNLNHSDSSIVGIWKGTSICQVKGSPCHDENVVYYVSKIAIDSFNIRANKIVNGVEEDMGIVPCRFEEKTNQLISTAGKGVWTFNVKGKSIDGTLMVGGALYRIIKVVKQD